MISPLAGLAGTQLQPRRLPHPRLENAGIETRSLLGDLGRLLSRIALGAHTEADLVRLTLRSADDGMTVPLAGGEVQATLIDIVVETLGVTRVRLPRALAVEDAVGDEVCRRCPAIVVADLGVPRRVQETDQKRSIDYHQRQTSKRSLGPRPGSAMAIAKGKGATRMSMGNSQRYVVKPAEHCSY